MFLAIAILFVALLPKVRAFYKNNPTPTKRKTENAAKVDGRAIGF